MAPLPVPPGLPKGLEAFLGYIDNAWGSGRSLPMWAPSHRDDPALKQWWGRFERLGASPAAVMAVVVRMISQIDISDILSSVHVPTLVIHCTGDTLINVEHGRFLAEHIAGARLLELPGDDHLFFIHEQICDAIEEFLTRDHERDPVRRTEVGVQAGAGADPAISGRLLRATRPLVDALVPRVVRRGTSGTRRRPEGGPGRAAARRRRRAPRGRSRRREQWGARALRVNPYADAARGLRHANRPSRRTVPVPACRGTGKVISNLGGSPSEIDCPWCDDTGTFIPEHDAQAAHRAADPTRAPKPVRRIPGLRTTVHFRTRSQRVPWTATTGCAVAPARCPRANRS